MMKKSEHIKYWLNTSEHDFQAAKDVFTTGRFSWSLFILHLSVEKLLKACWVKNNDNLVPPKIHNLVKLANHAKLNLSEEDLILLSDITSFNLETRYPDYKMEFYKDCDIEFTKEYFSKTEKLIKCIQKKI